MWKLAVGRASGQKSGEGKKLDLGKADGNFSDLWTPSHHDVIPKYSTSANVFKSWLDASAQVGLPIKMKDF